MVIADNHGKFLNSSFWLLQTIISFKEYKM